MEQLNQEAKDCAPGATLTTTENAPSETKAKLWKRIFQRIKHRGPKTGIATPVALSAEPTEEEVTLPCKLATAFAEPDCPPPPLTVEPEPPSSSQPKPQNAADIKNRMVPNQAKLKLKQSTVSPGKAHSSRPVKPNNDAAQKKKAKQ